MTYGLVPDYIVDWHRALLAALRVDYFRPGIQEMNSWRDFLFVLKSLDETPGGPFTVADLQRVVAKMRAQNKSGGNWSLRFSKIISSPEAFRDLVLETRRIHRERPAKITRSVATADGANVQAEADPAVEADAPQITQSVREQMEAFRRKMRGPAAERSQQ